jgi:hypothetical protein
MSRPIRVAPYTDEWVDAVRAFNQRIAASQQQLPETPRPDWMPRMEVFLAIEDDTVRGGYILRRQRFWAAGQEIAVAHYRLPLSEGVVNREYATLGLRLVRDAVAREPRLYAMCEVPFHFKVLRPSRFLRNIRPLRTTALRRLALDVAALSGAGWLAMKLMKHGAPVASVKHEMASTFSPWADEIWQRSRDSYAIIAERDTDTLDALYPRSDARFLRVRTPGGWAVLLNTQMRDHKQFGDMRVGSIVDCLAPPGEAGAVMQAATSLLENSGVDLIVSNQLHQAWSRALLDAGFRTGPSNYLVALSPAIAALAADKPDHDFHFNRGDGDGPIHL